MRAILIILTLLLISCSGKKEYYYSNGNISIREYDQEGFWVQENFCENINGRLSYVQKYFDSGPYEGQLAIRESFSCDERDDNSLPHSISSYSIDGDGEATSWYTIADFSHSGEVYNTIGYNFYISNAVGNRNLIAGKGFSKRPIKGPSSREGFRFGGGKISYFKDNELDGEFKEYKGYNYFMWNEETNELLTDGWLYQSGYYSNGKEEGNWKTYNEDGTIWSDFTYKDGEVIRN